MVTEMILNTMGKMFVTHLNETIQYQLVHLWMKDLMNCLAQAKLMSTVESVVSDAMEKQCSNSDENSSASTTTTTTIARFNVGKLLFLSAIAAQGSRPQNQTTLVDLLYHILATRVFLSDACTPQHRRIHIERAYVFCCGYLQSVELFFEDTSSSRSVLPNTHTITNVGFVPHKLHVFVTFLRDHCSIVPRSLQGNKVSVLLQSPRLWRSHKKSLEESRNSSSSSSITSASTVTQGSSRSAMSLEEWLWLIMLVPVDFSGDQTVNYKNYPPSKKINRVKTV